MASIETAAVHAGERRPGPEGSLVFPIYQGTVYQSRSGESYDEIQYLRMSTTPSQQYLADKLAELEQAEAAVATASGMAAISATLLSVLRAGDHLLVANVLYGGTASLLAKFADRLGWTYTFVDPQQPGTWQDALTPRTKALYVETISNPLIRVSRVREVADFCRRHGLVSIVDNTFASPVNLRPIRLGFDLVLHSATKYLGGHSDLVAGCVVGRADLVRQVRATQNLFGGSLDPHTGFLLARGIKTLGVRVRQQNANAGAIARFLAARPEVAEVHYPGLPSHPDHEYAAGLLDGFGGMLSFRLVGGERAVDALFDALRLPYVAPSLGGVETTITKPAVTSHASVGADHRARIGLPDDLVRLSCGIEAADDLVADFEQALSKI
uniref:homocysteine desulfhydrase n=1 Tax=Thermocrispum agreste TaxID=37925 RepID=A0A2W4L936_9PSEU|nr:MAG: cystathionine beta-lyase [Thermocrispum agreste]